MKINWQVRFKNKDFWVALIPMVLLLISQVAEIFGITLDFKLFEIQILAVVGTLFAIAGIIGVINDPTTASLDDSAQAMTYDEPKVS